jgi:hypothetical protein
VPTGIAGVVRVREAHWKTAEIRARAPAAPSDKPVESGMEHGRVHRFPERLLPVIAEPDDRLRPGFLVIGIASYVAPQDGATFLGKFPWKGSVNPNKPVSNKLL